MFAITHACRCFQVQFVHWNTSKYSSIEEAVGSRNGIAIVTMFGQVGEEHKKAESLFAFVVYFNTIIFDVAVVVIVAVVSVFVVVVLLLLLLCL